MSGNQTEDDPTTITDQMYLTDVSRGGLTAEDRAFLRGKEYSSDEARYNARRRVRNRIHDTILDLAFLMNRFEENTELVWEALDDDEYPELETAIGGAIALMFCGITEPRDLHQANVRPTAAVSGHRLQNGKDNHTSVPFLRALETAFDRAYPEYDILFEGAELHMETTRLPNLKTIRRHLEEGKILHPKLGGKLLESGKIDDEAFTELAREELLGDE